MKEATGEVSGTVITIVLIGIVLALGVWFFTGQGKEWISNIFTKNIDTNKTSSEYFNATP